MTGRTFIILLLVTVGLALGAIVAWTRREPEMPAASSLLYEDLTGRVDDVTAIEIETADDRFRIERGEAGWGLSTRGGYPVQLPKVKQTIVSLSRATVVEPKTSRPDLYERVIDFVKAENAAGANLRPQTTARGVGILFGLETRTPFDRAPARGVFPGDQVRLQGPAGRFARSLGAPLDPRAADRGCA